LELPADWHPQVSKGLYYFGLSSCSNTRKLECVVNAAFVSEHGNFMARLDVRGIEDRAARRFMQLAVKLTKRATSPVLTAAGGQFKLF